MEPGMVLGEHIHRTHFMSHPAYDKFSLATIDGFNFDIDTATINHDFDSV